jgi:hypothetical protein
MARGVNLHPNRAATVREMYDVEMYDVEMYDVETKSAVLSTTLP